MALSSYALVPRQQPLSPDQPTSARNIPTVLMSTRKCNGYIIVVLSGELDIRDAALVTAGLTAAAVCEPQVIVDLAGLEFIDCSGITALVHGRALARHAGGELRLAAPRPQVLRILTLIRLTDVIPVHTSVAEAVALAAPFLQTAAPPAGRPVYAALA